MDNLLFDFNAVPSAGSAAESLVDQLKRAEYAYYNGDPVLEDAEYDRLRDELVRLAPEHPHLAKVGAPVGIELDAAKRHHSLPMGSQRKAMNRKEFDSWLASVARKLSQEVVVPISTGELCLHLSEKLDGASVSLQFRDGEMVEAVSRGDGFVGEVLPNASSFQGIPPMPLYKGRPFSGFVRCEVILPNAQWEEIDPSFESNPRNLGNGIMRRSSGVDADKLMVVAFDARSIHGERLALTESELDQVMKEMGFATSPAVSGDVDTVWKAFEAMSEGRKDLPYWIDGAVVKLESIGKQEYLGSSDNRPNGQIALKFAAQGVSTVLEDVVWSVGHTGLISPTGRFSPVEISGTTVSSALLVHCDAIRELNVAIGDSVEIYKAGEIIPKLLRVTGRPDHRQVIEEPTSCPVCGGEVGRKTNSDGSLSPHLFCLNPDCSAKSTGKIKRFLSSLNILGVGDEVLESLVASNLVGSVADLYKLGNRLSEMAELEMGSSGVRLGLSRASKIVAEIDKTRSLTLSELLGSLGVEHLGKRRVQLILEAVDGKLDDLDRWFDGTLVDLAKEAKIPNKAEAIYADLLTKQGVVREILANGVSIRSTQQPVKNVGAKSFCATGALSMPRKEIEEMVLGSGNEWKSGVSAGLDFLIIADPESTSSKAQKARKLGVKCISEGDFLELIQG